MSNIRRYQLPQEMVYCSRPETVAKVDVAIIGSAIGLYAAYHLMDICDFGRRPRIAVLDRGPLNYLTHFAHTNFPRSPQIRFGTDGVGGKLNFWGMSTPRPPAEQLAKWGYDPRDLIPRFDKVERLLGVKDQTPFADRRLHKILTDRLARVFPQTPPEPAPLAINQDQKRWSPIQEVPDRVKAGLKIVARFNVQELLRRRNRMVGVRGMWRDGKRYTIRADHVVIATGVEPSIPLVQQMAMNPLPLEPGDHLRIDLHGKLPAGSFGGGSVDELGVAILIMNCRAEKSDIPYHLEIKVAPREHWEKGHMQSSDNLTGEDSPDTIYLQVQAVAAMHDRLRATDLLRFERPGESISPAMSWRDMEFHFEISTKMHQVACALGLQSPRYHARPLLTNHHLYGAYRVGKAVTRELRFQETENFYVLPPTAYVDFDDDANPCLKSLVLSQFAMEDIASKADWANQRAIFAS